MSFSILCVCHISNLSYICWFLVCGRCGLGQMWPTTFLFLTSSFLLQPSLWYNSPAKSTSYSAALGSVGIGTGTDVVSATPSHDGPAPSVLRENCEPVNSTRGGSPANAVSLLLSIHSNDFIPQENKITRDEMVKKMMIIVGEKLLLDSLTKLKYSVSYSGSILYLSTHLMITILRVNYTRLVYRAMFCDASTIIS